MVCHNDGRERLEGCGEGPAGESYKQILIRLLLNLRQGMVGQGTSTMALEEAAGRLARLSVSNPA